VVSSTPRPHFTPGKEQVPILQEAGWSPGPVWMGGKYRPHWDSIPDRPAQSQSLYRLSYRAHFSLSIRNQIPLPLRRTYLLHALNICFLTMKQQIEFQNRISLTNHALLHKYIPKALSIAGDLLNSATCVLY